MKLSRISSSIAISLACISETYAANYVPIDISATSSQNPAAQKASLSNLVTKRLNFLQSMVDVRGLSQTSSAATFSECTTPPTITDIGGDFELNRYVMTRSAAGKLGIVAGIGSTNTEGSGEQLLAVFDFSRSKECLATDGKTRVVYGQAVRTVMTFTSAENKTDITFPLIAASATVAGKSSSVSVKNIGFNDPAMASKAAAMSAISLSVESYSEFSKLHKELIDIATAAATQKQVQRLGIVPNVDDDELKETLPTAFALQAIKDGKSCDWAKQKLNMANDTNSVKALSSTYIYLTGTCSGVSPNSDARSKAGQYLKGMSVRV